MKAVLLEKFGPAENLSIGETKKPSLASSSLLVRIKAFSLNRADINQREGFYPPPPGASEILGLEMAGIVEEVAEDVKGWQKGDRVMALLPGGGYAEFCVIPEQMAIKIPDNLSFQEAAAIPEVWLTAFQALFLEGGFRAGEDILIHAAASGVGTAAIQIAKNVNANIVVTAGSDEKIKFCVQLGAKGGVNYKNGPWAESAKEYSSNKSGFDFVLDFVGAGYLEQNISVLKLDGRMVMLAHLGGKNDNLDLNALLKKRLTLKGSALRTRSLQYKTHLTKEFWKLAQSKFEDGSFKPIIDKVFDWKDVVKAHKHMEANQNIGKIVLTVS
eukprot:TRINITY_DN6137_c0_g1_i2.p1 TRINITY_DN6137_c0_g1~~TRINITY_DN6137_c0_g1_i2.p1  ORF type:complete len:342 (+),score=79.01 TRINITY_DN6137_c0_g1_i2:43-1026(+)